MNKRNLTVIGILLGIAVVGLLIFNYLQSFKTVNVSITQPGVTVTVVRVSSSQTQQKVGDLSASGKLSLQKGDYLATPAGTNINTLPIKFSVADKATSLVIHPGYSVDYLAQLLPAEQPGITAALTAAYPTVLPGFKVNAGQLYKDGDWYATTLIQNPPHPKENGDIYRTVLHKTNGTWAVAAMPQIVLTARDNPTIPIDILRDINQQTGY